jgi:hypothetical protein
MNTRDRRLGLILLAGACLIALAVTAILWMGAAGIHPI